MKWMYWLIETYLIDAFLLSVALILIQVLIHHSASLIIQ